ncbi:MAG: DNA-binding protein [Legionella sp.]|nr:MAG: DNA-binding protein [Legionella sp.]PJD97440.1 MAG: DNA-binding protein [Legionella sp.]
MKKTAKFNIGDVVIHQRSGYRAVIVDIDPLFQASGQYNPQAPKHEFATRNPWYRLLVDESSQVTYVEENLLAIDPCQEPVYHPNIQQYLTRTTGIYFSCAVKH